MIKIIDIVTGNAVCEINLNAASAPRLGEYVKTPDACYLVASRTYDVSELGNLNDIELKVTKVEG
jgi:hypothetical protein